MMIQNLLNSGTSEDQPQFLNNKIYLSNVLALIIAFGIALPFGIISLIHFKSIAYIPLSTIVIMLVMIVVNRSGANYFARLIIGLWPFVLTSLFNAFLTPAGEPPLTGIFALQLSFGIVPFLIFDIKEKGALIFSGLFVLISAIFVTPVINDFLERDFDLEVVQSGYVHVVSIITALLVSVGGASFMAYLNHKSNSATEKLMSEMDHQNEALKNSEEQMKENIEQIEENQKEERKRNWSTEGQAKFSNLLRSDQESDLLFDQLIAGVTKYINANQGGLFLVDSTGDDPIINLQACYAYDRKKFVEKTIAPGEGLVGQAYYEQEIIYMTDIPQNYVKITSGLGDALPTSLVIVPLIVNDSVEGFFEMASFNELEKHELDFLKQLGETVASFISTNRINEQTKYLLEETQQQAEEMRAQEEEMRQNMEELQATQEEMQRKENEYLERISKLETKLTAIKDRPAVPSSGQSNKVIEEEHEENFNLVK